MGNTMGNTTELKLRYTRHQVAQGARADGDKNNRFYLFKFVSTLRLTYQIQLLTLRARDAQRKLVIQVPKRCKLQSALRQFQKENSKTLRIERIGE